MPCEIASPFGHRRGFDQVIHFAQKVRLGDVDGLRRPNSELREKVRPVDRRSELLQIVQRRDVICRIWIAATRGAAQRCLRESFFDASKSNGILIAIRCSRAISSCSAAAFPRWCRSTFPRTSGRQEPDAWRASGRSRIDKKSVQAGVDRSKFATANACRTGAGARRVSQLTMRKNIKATRRIVRFDVRTAERLGQYGHGRPRPPRG